MNAAIAHMGGAADVRKSQQAFKNRSNDIIAQLRQHVPVVRLQQKIDTMVQLSATNAAGQVCLQVGPPAAAGGVPLYVAPHPNAPNALSAADLASYQSYGSSLARHVWTSRC